MTKDEIKQTYSMTDIVERYGFKPNRSGFIQCPFHTGDRTASMKIYEDNFYCYGCGETGDIFKFVMLMDGLSFKDAFISLGGEYKKPETKNDARHRHRDRVIAERKRQRAAEELERKKRRILEVAKEMDYCRTFANCYEPLSDAWCECMEGFIRAMAEFEELWEEVHNNGKGD